MLLWKSFCHCCKKKAIQNKLIYGVLLIIIAFILVGTAFNRDFFFSLFLGVIRLDGDAILGNFKRTFVTICTGAGMFAAIGGMSLITSVTSKVFKTYQQDYVLHKEIEDIDFSDEFPEAESHRNIKKEIHHDGI